MSSSSQFSKSLATLQLSPIVSISERARALAPAYIAENGEDFIYWQRGEINFPTPEYIVAACGKALAAGLTKYPKSGGETVFKEAIARKMARVNGAKDLKADDVIVTYGGQEALELVFKLFEGQRGAGFAPAWSCVLENFVPYCQIDFEEVPLNADFSVNYEALDEVLQKCRLLLPEYAAKSDRQGLHRIGNSEHCRSLRKIWCLFDQRRSLRTDCIRRARLFQSDGAEQGVHFGLLYPEQNLRDDRLALGLYRFAATPKSPGCCVWAITAKPQES
jgi:hypothetical protein